MIIHCKALHCEGMQRHIGWICLNFLHCAFSNVSSNCLCLWKSAVSSTPSLDRKIQTTRNNLNMNSQLWRKHEQGPEPMAWIRDQINNFSKSDNFSLKDVGTDHNFVIDQQQELLFSLRKVILMPSRITFLIEKSNSCVIENYWILYKCEKSNSRRNENCNQRELLSFFSFKDREK